MASGDGPVAAFDEACAGDGGGGEGEGEVGGFWFGEAGDGGGDDGADAGLDGGFVGGGGGLGGEEIWGEEIGVIDLDGFCGAGGEAVIEEVVGGGGGVEAGEQVDEGGFEGVSAVVFSFGEG